MENTELAEMKRRLAEPFDPSKIENRQIGGGGSANYLTVNTVIDRLNEACLSWSFEVKREWWDGDLLKAHVALTIPGLGTREHFGVIRPENKASNDDSNAKGHISDGLKKAATLFGVRVGEAHGASRRNDGGGQRRESPRNEYSHAPRGTQGFQGDRELNHDPGTASVKQIGKLRYEMKRVGYDDAYVCNHEQVDRLEDLSMARASDLIGIFMGEPDH